MEENAGPKVMLLDGDYSHTLQVAQELREDLRSVIIGVGTRDDSFLLVSRYCSLAEKAPPSHSTEYGESIVQLARKHHPDMVLPIGHRSMRTLADVRHCLPDAVKHCLPPASSLQTALNKERTLAAARAIGMRVPQDYTDLIRSVERYAPDTEALSPLPFPLMVKASWEAGRNIVAKVPEPSAFWQTYNRVRAEAEDGEVLVQEFVDGDTHTYGCGLLFIEGQVALSFCHDEVRSVPRLGGSATRARVLCDRHLEAISQELLRSLEWNGIALVEYKRNRDGSLVLMEVNPKFWASYPLASRCGYRFASTMVAATLGLPLPRQRHHRPTGEMVFPLRELRYCTENRESESLLRSAVAMLWPPAHWDVSVRDLRPWLLPGRLSRFARRVWSALASGLSISE